MNTMESGQSVMSRKKINKKAGKDITIAALVLIVAIVQAILGMIGCVGSKQIFQQDKRLWVNIILKHGHFFCPTDQMGISTSLEHMFELSLGIFLLWGLAHKRRWIILIWLFSNGILIITSLATIVKCQPGWTYPDVIYHLSSIAIHLLQILVVVLYLVLVLFPMAKKGKTGKNGANIETVEEPDIAMNRESVWFVPEWHAPKSVEAFTLEKITRI